MRSPQPRPQDLVEGALGGRGLETRGADQGLRIAFKAQHGGGGEQLVGVAAQAGEPHADRLAHALGDLRALAQAAQHLLDEERVAIRARVDGRRDRVVAQQLASERGDVLLGQPA